MPAAEPDAAGNRTRNLIFAPELNLAILENCTSKPREQQVWTYRFSEAKNRVQPPPTKPRETPAIVEEAYRRLAEYIAAAPETPGLRSETLTIGGITSTQSRGASWLALALQNSGAADLLRSYRKA